MCCCLKLDQSLSNRFVRPTLPGLTNARNTQLSRLDSNEGILELMVPDLWTVVPSKYDWNFTTIPQPYVNNRSILYKRGFVLGGSSSVSESSLPHLLDLPSSSLLHAQRFLSSDVRIALNRQHALHSWLTKRLRLMGPSVGRSRDVVVGRLETLDLEGTHSVSHNLEEEFTQFVTYEARNLDPACRWTRSHRAV